MSLGPLAAVLLVPVALVIGLRTHRWRGVIVVSSAVAIVALLVPTAAVITVAGALVSLIAGAVLLGTGVHAVARRGGTLSVADQLAGGLAMRRWRRQQVRRWSHAWARLARPLKL